MSARLVILRSASKLKRESILLQKKKKVKMEERCEENAIGVEGDDLDTGIAN